MIRHFGIRPRISQSVLRLFSFFFKKFLMNIKLVKYHHKLLLKTTLSTHHKFMLNLTHKINQLTRSSTNTPLKSFHPKHLFYEKSKMFSSHIITNHILNSIFQSFCWSWGEPNIQIEKFVLQPKAYYSLATLY